MTKILFCLLFIFSSATYAETEALPLKLAQQNGVNIYEAYLKVNNIWRELASKTSEKISDFEFLKSDQNKILENQELNMHFEDLIKVGRIRSNYIKYLSKTSPDFFQKQIDNGLLQDLIQEIKIIPMRWLGNLMIFALEVKNSLSKGFQGFKEITKMVFVFISFFIFPLLGIWVIRKITSYLDKIATEAKANRFKGVHYYSRYRLFSKLALYSKWPLYFVLFNYLKNSFPSYHFWFAAAELYIIYKFFLFITTNLFKSLKVSEEATEEKARRTALVISRIVFFSYFFLLFSQSVVGQGITFHLLKEVTFWVLILVSTILLAQWNTDLAIIIDKYNWGTIGNHITKLLRQKRFFFLAFPALFIVLVTRLIYAILNFLERFDFFKQISAQVFKRKLESSDAFQETDVESLPEEYVKLFEPFDRELKSEEIVLAHKDVREAIMKELTEWKNNPMEENSLVIHGDKGSGKTTLINSLLETLDDEINVVHLNMSQRFSTSEDILKAIGNLFELNLSESFAPLLQKDKELSKTLVIIDGAQNIFLSQMGGFEAYKTFTELINLRLENVYWLAAFNHSSWNFLKTVFKQNQSFRVALELKPWREETIKALILNRHKQLDYRLSFGQIVRVVQGGYDQEAMDNAEELFFRVLWEQSSGNPRVALYLWLSSLDYKGGKYLTVGLPHGDDLSILNKLTDDALFVYAAIMRHENLSAKETTSVTNLAESIVRYALKVGLENNFLLRRQNGQYTFNTRFQYTLNKFLRKKNFILGN